LRLRCGSVSPPWGSGTRSLFLSLPSSLRVPHGQCGPTPAYNYWNWKFPSAYKLRPVIPGRPDFTRVQSNMCLNWSDRDKIDTGYESRVVSPFSLSILSQLWHRRVTYPLFKWGVSIWRRTSRSEFGIVYRCAMMDKWIISNSDNPLWAFILLIYSYTTRAHVISCPLHIIMDPWHPNTWRNSKNTHWTFQECS